MIKTRLSYFIRKIKNNVIDKKLPWIKFGKKSVYSDFAPTDNLDKEQECLKALDWALKNHRITNIALTGPYGSGKSSVISSYCKLHPECKHINISLATFDGNKWDKLHEASSNTYGRDKIGNNKKNNIDSENINSNDVRNGKGNDDKSPTDAKELEEELEIGILKQLFYKINADKIPLSRYRKLHDIKLHKYVVGVFATFAVAWTIMSLVFPETISAIMSDYFQKLHSPFAACMFFGAAAIIMLGISCLIRFVTTKFTIKEVSVGDAKIQGQEISKESILNKNMDEMLYFFEKTKYNVVFIEDLDRFNTTAIFTKLREINKILNQYEVIKRRIVFVYAVKDDLFNEITDRTKFFDFTIPIVPVINFTNSGEIMRKFLGLGENNELNREYPEHHVSDGFIKLVSPFIGDMRVLISVINEFWMYKRTLMNGPKEKLSDDCLLALIIYKNLYPKDFALLEAESGDVKEAFNHKASAIKKAKEELDKKREQLEIVQNDCLKSIKEIKIIILSEILNYRGMITRISVLGKTYKYSQLLNDDFSFDVLKQEKIDVYFMDDPNHYEQSMPSITELEESNPIFSELFARYDALCALKDRQHEKMLLELEKIDKDIIHLSSNTLKQLIETYSVEEVLPASIRKNDLLILLLREGYINEDYAEYINHFRPGSISSDELKFILSVRNHRSMDDFSLVLKHCDNVCDLLFDYEFEQPEALNFTLLDYLLDSEKNKSKLQCLIQQIANGSLLSRNFIKSYIVRNIKVEQFLRVLCHESDHVWADIVQDAQLSTDAKDQYLSLIIKSCDVEDICKNDYKEKEDDDGGIRKYFEEDKNILVKLSDIPTSQIKDLINAMDIHFVELNVEGLDLELVDFIIEGRYYVLNRDMMNAIFKVKGPSYLETLFCANYHCVCALGCDGLLDYIYDDFASYIQKFVLDIESNTEEGKDDVDDIIDRLLEISEDMCVKVIEKEHLAYWDKLSTCLVNYEDTGKKAIWDYLIQNGRTDVSWDNYLAYHNIFGLTPVLLKYANDNMQALVDTQSDVTPTDDIVNELMVDMLSDDNFKLLISAFKVSEITNALENFEYSKLNILIDAHYLAFTVESYLQLKQISYELSDKFALTNKTEFFESIAECEIGVREAAEYIGQHVLTPKEVTALLECIVPDEMDEKLAQQLRTLDFKVPKAYVEAAWDVLKTEEKYQLLYNQLDVYTLDELAKKFGELGGDYKQFAERTKHKYSLYADDGGFNWGLCEKLFVKGFLSSYDEVEEKVGWLNNKLEKRIVGYVKKNSEPKQKGLPDII